MRIAATEESSPLRPKLPPTPYGEADASKIIFERMLEAADVKTESIFDQGRLAMSVTIPGTLSGQQVVQMFFQDGSAQILRIKKDSTVVFVSSSGGMTFLAPQTPWHWGNPHQVSNFAYNLLSASQSTSELSSSHSLGWKLWHSLIDRFLQVLPALSTLSSRAETLPQRSEERAKYEPAVLGLRIPRRRIIATLGIRVKTETLPRRKPHVFLDEIEEDA